jgi:phage-related tail fiber protein
MALTQLNKSQILANTLTDSQINPSAAIQTSKLADSAKFIFADGSRSFTAPVSGVTPSADAHLATWGSIMGLGLAISGDASGSCAFTNRTINLTLSNSGVTAGTYGDNSHVPVFNVDAKGRITTVSSLAITPASIGAINTNQLGIASGVATLDSTGKVPAVQLPSYVDDVVEGANLAAFPGTGESGKIYVALDSNKAYRWSGSVYVEISAAPGSTDSVVEGSTNLYFTPARAQAAVTSVTGNAGTATKLATARSIAMTGDVTWSIAAFDGSSNVTAAGTLANSGVTAGTYKSITVDAKGRVTAGTNPTTLSGYGITDAQPIDADLTAIAALAGTSGLLKKTAANTWALDTTTYLTANQVVTLSGDATGSGSTSITVTLANTGVVAGTYNSVTVDAKGRVTAGTSASFLQAANIVTRETPSGLVNGSNTVFVLANTPIAGTEEVFINGLLMEPGAGNDYTISGSTITTLFVLQPGDKIRVSYFK